MRTLSQSAVALIQSDQVYLPETLADRIEDMGRTDSPGGTLRSAYATSPWEPNITFSGYILGICAAESAGGANQLLVVRAGDALYVHQGWNRVYASVHSGLTYDVTSRFPDAMTVINGRIIWSNGVDQPVVVDGTTTYGRLVVPLGFDRPPGQPSVLCPNSGGDTGSLVVPNYGGYSHPGGIGTVQSYGGEDGAMLAGAWEYVVVWEDVWGNLSPPSAPATATLSLQSTGYLTPTSGDYTRLNHLDSMTRSFVLRGVDDGEAHVAAIHVYRTQDTLHADSTPRLLTRIPGRERFTVPDGESDGVLAARDPLRRVVPVQPHRVSCAYQGRLVAANFQGAPGMVRWSDPGFPGTFPEDSYAITDGGAEVTGVAAWGDYLVVFTDDVVYRLSITPGQVDIKPLYRGIGCAAPCSIQSLGDGRLVWLAAGGVYALSQDGSVLRLSEAISRRMYRLNGGYLGRAVSAIDPATGRYVLSVCTGGSFKHDRVLVYDPRSDGWTEATMGGWSAMAMCAQPGHARHLLLGGYLSGSGNQVRVWDRQSVINGQFMSSYWYSNLLRMDEMGLTVFRVREVIVHFRESCVIAGGSAFFRYWRTDRKEDDYGQVQWDACGTDVTDTWPYSGTTVGADGAIFRDPQIRSRKFSLDINNCTGFRFAVLSTANRIIELIGFSFTLDTQGTSTKAPRIPGPTRS